jgi:NTE family protein
LSTSTPRKKLGLALGSGAARGLAHIGVLKVLEEADIQIDLIAGTSMGAFIGAMYASGVPVARMEEVARDIDWRRMTSLLDPVLPTSGLIDGKKLLSFMAQLLPARTFEELHLPLAITATDIHSGEAIIIKQGDLLEALRAGLAFPGIFSPARFGRRFLVDGGLCNPVPADVARRLGADHVIGVCAIPEVSKQAPETFLPPQTTPKVKERAWLDLFNANTIEQAFRRVLGQEDNEPAEAADRRTPNIFRVCAQSVAIMENEINDLRLRQNHHDLIIRPPLEDITLLEFHRADEIIAAGEAEARAELDNIHRLILDD